MPEAKSTADVLHPSRTEALKAWASQVKTNRDQAERWREGTAAADFYAPTAAIFKVDLRRQDEAALNYLKSLTHPDDRWLDIGAGGGRYALPLALLVREVVAVDPSQSMLGILQASMQEHQIRNIRLLENRWPFENPPRGDVALISHVGYDIEDIGPFLEAMELSASRLCVAVFRDSAPSSAAEPYWPLIHAEKREPLPALREFLSLQLARGALCEVKLIPGDQPGRPDRERRLAFLRQQLFIQPGGQKDLLLQRIVDREMAESESPIGPGEIPARLGIVSWTPVRR
jgi:SAM-dependent methyltransferase